MSIVTNQWVDALAYEFGLGLGLAMPSNSLPNGGPASNSAERKTKRTFFESAARWDSGAGQVFVESTDVRLVRQRLEVNGSRRYGAIADVFANGKAHDGEGDEGRPSSRSQKPTPEEKRRVRKHWADGCLADDLAALGQPEKTQV